MSKRFCDLRGTKPPMAELDTARLRELEGLDREFACAGDVQRLARADMLRDAADELDRLRGVKALAEAIPATCGGRSLRGWGNYFNRYGPLTETLTEDDMNELCDLFCTLVALAAEIQAKPE